MAQTSIGGSAHTDPAAAARFLAGNRLTRFEALQRRLVPRSASFSDGERSASRDLVDDFLGRQPTATRRKLALFLFVIDLLSLFSGLRPFRRLSPSRQDRLLRWLFDCPVGLLRKGFWGLNTVARLGVYGQATLHAEIHYRLRDNPDE
jgi:hypothetical protein